jgi:hypothetical protein
MAKTLRTESGAPVADNQNSQTAGPRGPVLLQDQHLLEKLARFNCERIPERIVHAVGSGAHGSFEVTHPDVARWTERRSRPIGHGCGDVARAGMIGIPTRSEIAQLCSSLNEDPVEKTYECPASSQSESSAVQQSAAADTARRVPIDPW